MSDPISKGLRSSNLSNTGNSNKVMDLNSFPRLQLNSNDVTGSWNDWLAQFEITIELTTLNLGKRDGGGCGSK